MITDFDNANDQLNVRYYIAEGVDPGLYEGSLRQNGDTLEVLVNNQVVAQLPGITGNIGLGLTVVVDNASSEPVPLIGTDGADTLTGTGSDTVIGGAGDDVLIGQMTGSTTALAVTTPGILQGGDGDDTLIGGPGDLLTGGDGADLFEVHSRFPASGPTVITDFDNATDQLQVTYYIPEGEDPGLYEGSLRQNGDTLEVLVNNQVVVQLPGITGNIGWGLTVAPDNP